MKCLDISLIKYVQDLYAKTLIKEIKEYQISGNKLCLWMKWFNIVKMSFLSKLIAMCFSLLDYKLFKGRVMSNLTS